MAPDDEDVAARAMIGTTNPTRKKSTYQVRLLSHPQGEVVIQAVPEDSFVQSSRSNDNAKMSLCARYNAVMDVGIHIVGCDASCSCLAGTVVTGVAVALTNNG